MSNETLNTLIGAMHLEVDEHNEGLNRLADLDHKHLKDLRINLSNVLASQHMTRKEALLTALSVAINEHRSALVKGLTELAKEEGVNDAELGELYALVSVMSTNNVLYRFRHYAEKEIYETTPAAIKMNTMMNPVLGKELFELISLALSAVNGCERCVRAHEDSVAKLGASPKKIFDAIRIASVVKGAGILL